MSKIKKIPAVIWFVIGVLAALVVVPTAAYAAALKFTGIEGTSGNEADVTAAHQLLTTQESPGQFVSYESFSGSVPNATGCASLVTVPAGDSFVIQNIQVDVSQAEQPQYVSYVNTQGQTAYYENSISSFGVAYASSFCPTFPTNITTGEAPAGGIGNVTIPVQPGFVVPAGTDLMVTTAGVDAWFYVSGYLVPSADAPVITPQTKSSAHPEPIPTRQLVTPPRP